jgi:lambda repressor-like predicted transcriptional regulator
MELIRPPQNSFERQIWVVAMLKIKKSSFSEIARELGTSRQAVQKVQTRKNRRVESAIAAKIGYVPEFIWPERYQTHLAEQYRNIPGDSTRKPKSKNRY